MNTRQSIDADVIPSVPPRAERRRTRAHWIKLSKRLRSKLGKAAGDAVMKLACPTCYAPHRGATTCPACGTPIPDAFREFTEATIAAMGDK